MSRTTRDLMAQKEQKKKIHRLMIWGGVVLVLAGIVWVMIKAASSQSQTLSSDALAPGITAADWTEGNRNAKVTLIEYGDYQCPACAAYYPIVKKAVSDYQDKILFVFRNFPLSQHPNALPAASAAEAAGAQGKFWEMLGLLYQNQNSWSDLSNPRNQFEVFASQLGLNLEKFRSDEISQAVQDKIQKDSNGGFAAGIDHTPTFFVNLKQIPNPQSYDDFKSVINQALSAAS